ncbi:N-acyl amino acid synthase FeeM domain-containing protein [Pelagibacterium montanilacus]|uniref:N-acyl amino acid synthase FeeM domain-containing protein n=1 Tax=Pelagibacterium montanilacus TaxID=2185280 RepID=UPI000F8F3FBF|nr:hypothetical protein [Pelagibacterium montanilacus]
MDILDRVEYRRVRLDEIHDPIFRLRYEAYRREEGVPFNVDRIVREDLDLVPNAMCYGVYIDGALVSSIRLHHVTADFRRSPCMSVWPDVLSPWLDAGRTFIDPSRFTADRDATLAFPALPFLTLRVAAMACEYFEVDHCLSGVRDEHAPFYKRVFGAVPIAEERTWGGATFSVKLHSADVRDIRNRVADRFPFFMSTPEERERMFGGDPDSRFLSPVVPTARVAAIAENRFAPAQ